MRLPHQGMYLTDKQKDENFLTAKKYELAYLNYMAEQDDIQGLTPSPFTYDSYDAMGMIYAKWSLIEVKIRDIKSTAYPTAYVELSKFRSIYKDIKKEEKELYYLHGVKTTAKLLSIYPSERLILQFDMLTSPHIIDRNVKANAVTCGGSGLKRTKEFVGYLIKDAEARYVIPDDIYIEDYFPTDAQLKELNK